MTSTKKRVKKEAILSIQEADKRNEKRHSELLSAINKANDHRKKFNELFEVLLSKMQLPYLVLFAMHIEVKHHVLVSLGLYDMCSQ